MKFTIRLETTYDASTPGTGTVLANRVARSSTAAHGWPAVIAGLIATTAGIGFAAIVSGVVGQGVITTGGFPAWILTLMGGLFAVAGASAGIHGLRGIVRMAGVRRLQAAHPHEPWRWDHVWNDRIARDDTADRARQFFVASIFFLLFLMPFHWIGFFVPKAGMPFAVVALLFDLVAVGMLVTSGYFFLRRIKYGHGTALFGQFPFRRGSTLELHVQVPRSLPQHAVPMATLRCVQERYVTTGTGKNKHLTVECCEIYRDTAQLEQVASSAGQRAMRIRFQIPADAPATDLSSRPCRYWEVDVEAPTDGVDYAMRFLVPVY